MSTGALGLGWWKRVETMAGALLRRRSEVRSRLRAELNSARAQDKTGEVRCSLQSLRASSQGVSHVEVVAETTGSTQEPA